MIRAITLIMLLLAVGCSEPTAPGERQSVRVETDKAEYGQNQDIIIRFHYPDDTQIHVNQCCGFIAFFVERMDDNLWQTYRSIGSDCREGCETDPLPLTKVHADIYKIKIVEPGRYRVTLPFSQLEGIASSAELMFSAAFTVR